MVLKYKNAQQLLFLFAIVFFLLINVFTIKNGHNWGGDFSQYISNAKNLVEYKGYSQGIMLNNPITYPPGYPILLAPLIKVFGLSFPVLKFLNIFFWYLSLLFFYRLLVGRFDKTMSSLGVIFLASSFYLFTTKQNIISDIPFMFFTISSIYFFTEFYDSNKQKNNKLWVALFLMSFGFLTRSAGLMLFFAAFYYTLFIRRDWKTYLITLLAFVVTLLFQVSLCGLQPGFFSKVLAAPMAHAFFISKNFPVIFNSILWNLTPGEPASSFGLYFILSKASIVFTIALYLGILILFCYKSFKRSLSFMGCFVFFYLFLLLFWAGFNDSAQNFSRFMIAIFPFIFLYGINAFIFLGKCLSKSEKDCFKTCFFLKIFLILFIVFNLYKIIGFYNFNDDILSKKENVQLFQWVEKNIKSNERYLFNYPRVMYLMTGKLGTSGWVLLMTGSNQVDKVSKKIKENDIKYMIFEKRKEEMNIKVFQQDPSFMSLAWENKTFKVFEVKERLK
jgi:4-amino-4-deoxy-L-arabinose transferase-like glycosyltransferase